jgi:DeoR/GlpR family transcriptional regulator of sugar metabolism
LHPKEKLRIAGAAARLVQEGQVVILDSGTTTTANRADEATRRAAGLLIELGLEAPEFLRPAAAVIPGQLLGYYLSRKNGIDADRPPYLNRVVSLDPETESIP